MNPSLSLFVWFVVLLIIIFIFWLLFGYDLWPSFIMAVLISLVILIIIFPWNFERRHDDEDCVGWQRSAFFLLVGLSVLFLIIYIISTYIWI